MGAFVLDPDMGGGTTDDLMPFESATTSFERNVDSSTTFFNTHNMRRFYQSYDALDTSTMETMFGFSSWDQVEYAHAYFENAIENFLQQGATYDVIALSSLMNTGLNNTFGFLETTLPMTVTSRLVSNQIVDAGLTCQDFFMIDSIGLTQEEADTACTGYDFSDPNSVRDVMNVTWYND